MSTCEDNYFADKLLTRILSHQASTPKAVLNSPIVALESTLLFWGFAIRFISGFVQFDFESKSISFALAHQQSS
jgi:hypothetical protein